MLRLSITTIALAFFASISHASVVTNGPLFVDIRNDNGAIDTVRFGGADFYNPGTPISDFGLQVGTNTSTFRRNDTNGPQGINVAAVGTLGDTVFAIGVYNAGANIEVSRAYSLVPGQNVLRVETILSNFGGSRVSNLRLFDTADPDQGQAFGLGTRTFNDRLSLGGGDVLQSTINTAGGGDGLTTIWGFAPTAGFGNGGFGFQIDSGGELNNFFTSGGGDPNGSFQDISLALGFETSLNPGESATFSYLQAYGTTIADAQSAFLAALTPTNPTVPEPTSLIVWGLLGAVGLKYRRR